MKKILILIVVIILVLSSYFIYQQKQSNFSDQFNNKTEQKIPAKTFESLNYSFSLSYPDSWQTFSQYDEIEPKINFYDSQTLQETNKLPLNHFMNETNVSVFPLGIPTEGLFGQTLSIEEANLNFPYELSPNSRVYILENGQPFAAYLIPVNHPENWKDYGFIWVRSKVDNLAVKCQRGTEEIAFENCDPLTQGDEIIWQGNVNPEKWQEALSVIESFKFTEEIPTENSKQEIILQTPKEKEIIQSPLSITGKIKGPWLFEATAPVILVDWDGRIIAESYIEAQDNWMTEDYVSFSSELKFEEPDDIGDFSNRGTLIFQKANPSGLAENDDAFEMEIRFR